MSFVRRRDSTRLGGDYRRRGDYRRPARLRFLRARVCYSPRRAALPRPGGTRGRLRQIRPPPLKNFGWQWQHFVQTDELYADQFLGWIAPVRPEFFRNKSGVGGRLWQGSSHAAGGELGCARDHRCRFERRRGNCFAATRKLENAHIVQADIYQLPFAREFDYAFSIGVLHHLPDPRAGFRSLAGKVKAGGSLSAWVYGAENNEWITPLRRSAARGFQLADRSPRLVAAFKVARGVAVPGDETCLWTTKPLRRRLGVGAPSFYNDYLNAISHFVGASNTQSFSTTWLRPRRITFVGRILKRGGATSKQPTLSSAGTTRIVGVDLGTLDLGLRALVFVSLYLVL